MKKMFEKLERLFAAISYAEAGEHGTARSLMVQQGRIAEVHTIGGRREAAVPASRPAKRAA